MEFPNPPWPRANSWCPNLCRQFCPCAAEIEPRTGADGHEILVAGQFDRRADYPQSAAARLIEKCCELRQLALPPRSIKAILLTHGHLDHAGNLARLKNWTGAKIYAHPAEQAHIDGTYRYRGINQWCGRLEAVGRKMFSYQRATIDEFL